MQFTDLREGDRLLRPLRIFPRWLAQLDPNHSFHIYCETGACFLNLEGP